ncbi:integrase, catalytic region, zinc finger, CCHC-type containing protein [Tanacetum coccineum]|uniref:Integrase, catalytic region, zinc finger, CCHC-type containing protein n=1 Tax=Tanacetum coccineum TaxID=301880 RepID=A0ABQ5EUA7_9ASTR
MTESPFVDSGFVVPVFSPRDDPIACLNKAMAFLTAVASSRVTVQQVQGRQGQNYSGTTYKGNATSSRGNTTSGQARVVKCYNCQGEGHMARQCTQPKRPRNAAWYKEKAMLAEAQEAGQILDEEQLTFLADPGIPAEVPNSKTYLNDMDNQSVHALQDFEQSPATVQDTNLQAQQDSMILSVIEQMSEQMINHVNNWEKANKEQNNETKTAELERYKERVKKVEQQKLALKEQVDSLEQNLSKQIKEKESVLQTFAVFKNESKEKENKYMENEIDLEKKIKELDNIICKVVEVPSELPKVSLVNASLKKLKFHLTEFDTVLKKRITPNALEEGEWGFENTKTIFNNEIIPFLKYLKDIFNVFDKDLLNEITKVQIVFDQMEVAVQQSSVDKQCLEIAKKEILLENDRLLQKVMSQDVLLTMMNSMSFDYVNMEMQKCESCDKCLNLDAELSKSNQAYKT